MYNKKAHPVNQMSFEYCQFDFLSFDLTYLSRLVGMELAPCLRQVVKASSGHFPQPFLISNKELVQR
jgi:hypothetical protein